VGWRRLLLLAAGSMGQGPRAGGGGAASQWYGGLQGTTRRGVSSGSTIGSAQGARAATSVSACCALTFKLVVVMQLYGRVSEGDTSMAPTATSL
jgi:hypothetical protein